MMMIIIKNNLAPKTDKHLLLIPLTGLCTVNIQTLLMSFKHAVTDALDAFILKAAAGSGRVWPLGKRQLSLLLLLLLLR